MCGCSSQDYHTTYIGFVPEKYPARGPSTQQDFSDLSVSYHPCLGYLSRFKVLLVKKCLYKLQELPYTRPTTTIKIFVRILPLKMLSRASFSYIREKKEPSGLFVNEVVFSKLSSSEGSPKLKRLLPIKEKCLDFKH